MVAEEGCVKVKSSLTKNPWIRPWIIGSNNEGNGNENVKKSILLSKTTDKFVRALRSFVHIFAATARLLLVCENV